MRKTLVATQLKKARNKMKSVYIECCFIEELLHRIRKYQKDTVLNHA